MVKINLNSWWIRHDIDQDIGLTSVLPAEIRTGYKETYGRNTFLLLSLGCRQQGQVSLKYCKCIQLLGQQLGTCVDVAARSSMMS